MNWIIVRVITLILAAQGVGCSARLSGEAPATKKISEQHLSAYTPLRRLTYQNACGGNGPLSVCADLGRRTSRLLPAILAIDHGGFLYTSQCGYLARGDHYPVTRTARN